MPFNSKQICLVLFLGFASTASATVTPAPVKQIELLAANSPYMQIEGLKQRLSVAERLAAPTLPREVQDALAENPEIIAAMSPEGWEKVFFRGIGDAQMKQAGSRALIKIPATKTSEGLLVLAQAMTSMIGCGSGNICIALDSAALNTKSNSNKEDQ
jgi:hypothetical protein